MVTKTQVGARRNNALRKAGKETWVLDEEESYITTKLWVINSKLLLNLQ